MKHRRNKIAAEHADFSTDAYRAVAKDFYTDLRETWERFVEEVLLGNARTQTGDPAFVEAVMADAGSRSGPSGDPVIRVELAAARVSITGAASPVLVGAVLRALR